MTDILTTLTRLTNRPTRTAEFTRPLDPNDAAKVAAARKANQAAQARLERVEAKATDPATLAAAQADAEAAQAAHDAAADAVATFTLHLRAVAPYRCEELQREHRPTPKQLTDARNADATASPPEVNAETYPPALIAEAIDRIEISDGATDPVTSITPEAVAAMWRDWPGQDQMLLFAMVKMISEAGSNVDLGTDLGKG